MPKVLPRKQSEYFGNAIVAFQSGQTLAALFLLRVFIEQYWRSLEVVSKKNSGKAKPTGDELGAAYNATLPDDFKSRFPSLLEIYKDLSAAIHLANPDGDLFQDATRKVTEHFDARRLFKLAEVPESSTRSG
jgi:hypothetical protein